MFEKGGKKSPIYIINHTIVNLTASCYTIIIP